MNSADKPDRGASLEGSAGFEPSLQGDGLTGDDNADELVGHLQPQELLRRIAMEPARKYLLGICKEHLLETALLMDSHVLCAGAAAHVVVALTGVAPLQWVQGIPVPESVGHAWGDWLRERAGRALQMLLHEDREAHAMGRIQPEPEEPRHAYLTSWLEIEAGDVLGAAVRFNGLCEPDRRAFFLICVQEKAMDDCLGLGLGSPKEILQRAESAVRVMVSPPPPEAPLDLGGLLS